MKVRFQLVIEGGESLDEKLKKALQEDPTLHLELIRSFGCAVMMALRLKEHDNISVTHFNISRMEEEKEEEKKVDT